MYYTLSAISVLSQVDTSRNQSLLTFLKGAVLTGLLFWSVVGMFSGGLNHAAATSRIGIISAILSIAYYASPLSTAAMVIDKRDATSLYTPMITVNLLNAILWIFYGSLGIHQPQVWVPNAVGAALAISQLILVWIYPSRAEESQPLIQRNAAQVSPASFVRHKAEGVGKTFQQQPPQQQQT